MRPANTIRNYVLEARIGAGGMGEVWRARHTLLDRIVAIKIVSDKLLDRAEFEERFVKEARAQSRLQHPNIIPVTDFFHEDNRYFLVMPLIEGQSLAARLAARGALPVEESLRIAADALSALDYAHQQGVIHRDVTPTNILLDHQGRAWLMDFGIAMIINEERRTRTGQSIGNPHYMSPEQIRQPKLLDHRTDVYSFGCVLYEMLTGRAPFEASNDEGDVDYLIKEAQVHRRPEPLRKWNDNVPETVEVVVSRALAKNPDDRFSGCGEFARALTQAATRKKTEIELDPAPFTPQPAPAPPQPPPTPTPPAPAPAESAWLIAPGARLKFALSYVLLSVIGGFAGSLPGNDAHYLVNMALAAVLLGAAQWVALRKRLRFGWVWIVVYIGVYFVGAAFFELFYLAFYSSSDSDRSMLLIVSRAVGGILLWDALRRQVRERWLAVVAGPVAIMTPAILALPRESIPSELDLAMVYGFWRGLLIGLVQALCLIRLHRREDSVPAAPALASSALARALQTLLGGGIGVAMALIIILTVNAIKEYSWFGGEESALAILFGGALPGAIIGLFSSLQRRTLHLLAYGTMVTAVDYILFVAAAGDREKAPLALIIGAPVGVIIAFLTRTIARRWSKAPKSR